MNIQEVRKLILALREEGWGGDDIDDLLLYLESKEDTKYLPRKDKKQ